MVTLNISEILPSGCYCSFSACNSSIPSYKVCLTTCSVVYLGERPVWNALRMSRSSWLVVVVRFPSPLGNQSLGCVSCWLASKGSSKGSDSLTTGLPWSPCPKWGPDEETSWAPAGQVTGQSSELSKQRGSSHPFHSPFFPAA